MSASYEDAKAIIVEAVSKAIKAGNLDKKKEEIRQIMRGLGGDRLSKVDPSKYDELIEKVRAL